MPAAIARKIHSVSSLSFTPRREPTPSVAAPVSAPALLAMPFSLRPLRDYHIDICLSVTDSIVTFTDVNVMGELL
jgi:hypothetical protein